MKKWNYEGWYLGSIIFCLVAGVEWGAAIGWMFAGFIIMLPTLIQLLASKETKTS